ncbi:hypothetical protein [Castellaniella sp.]|uniref:hypothetical protein n=1 Tax=Castellaniella sp. TaxID=1955812 RepID=UPI002AFEA9FA|nr:hypothetical protein [Castellaniella sp.]
MSIRSAIVNWLLKCPKANEAAISRLGIDLLADISNKNFEIATREREWHRRRISALETRVNADQPIRLTSDGRLVLGAVADDGANMVRRGSD